MYIILISEFFWHKFKINKMISKITVFILYSHTQNDDTFTVFENIEQSENFLKFINTFHPNLKFTIDHESNNRLPFLDVLVDNSKQDLSFSVYRKKTFTGLSINFFSFCPLNFKINAFKTLLHRSYNICSNYHILHNEIENLQKLFTNNEFPFKLFQNLTKKFLNNKISPVKPVITVPKRSFTSPLHIYRT